MKIEFIFGFLFIMMALAYVTFQSDEGAAQLNNTGILERVGKDSDEDDDDFIGSDYETNYKKIEMAKMNQKVDKNMIR